MGWPRHRRRPLARTISRARWTEYRNLLRLALDLGYELWSLEDWLRAAGPQPGLAIIIRHDVDQHPRSVLPMLAIERELGVRSTWYFRWRTAVAPVVDAVRDAGGHVGLHYETLTRLVLERGLTAGDVDGALVAEARAVLRRELAAFGDHFGPVVSACPHGDSRVPGVSNQILLEGQPYARYGIAFDGNEAVNRYPLSLWLTDRSTPDGRWKDGLDPGQVLAAGTTPILLVIHPNNWCSGLSLWRDRLLAAALPRVAPGRVPVGRFGIVRTGSDAPPKLSLAALSPPVVQGVRVIDFAPICASLKREILRFYYDGGHHMVDEATLNTLATNSDLAEARAATLEDALADAGVGTVRGLALLDAGCGFGALALVFAAHGARVLGIDSNQERMSVGRDVAVAYGLPVSFRAATMQSMPLPEGSVDVAVMNNSLCYLVDRGERQEALRLTLATLRPDGALVVRNPNRLHPRDQFTGVPLLGLLPPRGARLIAALLRRHRSNVRLLSNRAARRELKRAGFTDVRSYRRPGESRLRAAITGYQHLTARRPEA